MSLVVAFVVVLAACLPPDLVWYELGRRRGPRVLVRICAISLEPDWCVRRTESLFARFGWRLLLVAKFVPGLSAVAAPLAGSAGVVRWQFILLDITGRWSGPGPGWGLAMSSAMRWTSSPRWLARLGGYALLLAGAASSRYVGYRYAKRRRIFRELRMARITPEELRRRIDAGARRPGHHRHPIGAGCEAGAVSDPRRDMDRRRRGRQTPRRAAAGPGNRPLLHLTQRSHQRPGGAPASSDTASPGSAPFWAAWPSGWNNSSRSRTCSRGAPPRGI